jgi:hypothetical protein
MMLPDQLRARCTKKLLTEDGEPLAIAQIDGPAAKPMRVFNL